MCVRVCVHVLFQPALDCTLLESCSALSPAVYPGTRDNPVKTMKETLTAFIYSFLVSFLDLNFLSLKY